MLRSIRLAAYSRLRPGAGILLQPAFKRGAVDEFLSSDQVIRDITGVRLANLGRG